MGPRLLAWGLCLLALVGCVSDRARSNPRPEASPAEAQVWGALRLRNTCGQPIAEAYVAAADPPGDETRVLSQELAPGEAVTLRLPAGAYALRCVLGSGRELVEPVVSVRGDQVRELDLVE